jgi:hypothetical protein
MGLAHLRIGVRHQTPQPDRLCRQSRRLRVAGRDAVVAHRIGTVDRGQHVPHPVLEVPPLRQIEPDPRRFDLGLHPRQALAQRRRRDQEDRGHALRVEAEDDLQHQGRPQGRVDRRMRADEHQRQSWIGRRGGGLGTLLRHAFQLLVVGPRQGARPHRIDRAVSGGRRQPGLGMFGNAGPGPDLQRPDQRRAECILGIGERPDPRGQAGDQPAVGQAGHPFDRAGRVLCHDRMMTGRTSTAPLDAAGFRAAHSSAVSRSGTSITKKPPSCSFVAA